MHSSQKPLSIYTGKLETSNATHYKHVLQEEFLLSYPGFYLGNTQLRKAAWNEPAPSQALFYSGGTDNEQGPHYTRTVIHAKAP